MNYDWEYVYTITDKSTQQTIHSAIRYTRAPTEPKLKEIISRDIRKKINTYTRTVRWKTLKNHNNIIYCRKENSMYSILAKIKLIPQKEKPCLTPMMLKCNAS